MTSREDSVPVDDLKMLMLKVDKICEKEEDVSRDTTPITFRGLRQKLEKGETPLTSIFAQTRKGKSTLALHLMDIGNSIICDLNMKESMYYWDFENKNKIIDGTKISEGLKEDFERECLENEN